MTKRSHAAPVVAAPATATYTPRAWLLFVSQTPTSPSNVRVRMWRRLQQLGAIAVRQAVYVLPDTPQAREDFEWLKASVSADGGDATIFTATAFDRDAERVLTDEFRLARKASYAALADDIESALSRTPGRQRGVRAPALDRLARSFTERLATIERVDFFGSAGRDRVAALLARLDKQRATPKAPQPGGGPAAPSAYANRLWVTRPRPGVDRMSSAWLIRRFIDSSARFAFATDVAAAPEPDAIAFDMFGAEFSHRGDACTFEVLRQLFGIRDAAVDRIAALVHDLDLRDAKFGAPDAPTVAALIDGLQLAIDDDDDQLLQHGMTLFDSLYRGFSQTTQPPRPRPVASTRTPDASGKPHPATRALPRRPAGRARRPTR
jgi:hypothetical protein